MTSAVPDILARIVEHKRTELARAQMSADELHRRAERQALSRRSFREALKTPAIIAEIKKASPSKGILSADFDPAGIARQYEAGGAAALSVLTDERFFQGSLDDLVEARSATGLPVLRKDFTISPYHVIEAAAHGADAILLIAAILTERQMRELRELAARYRMDAIVEVHNEDELDAATGSGAAIIGVNNRDLHTFQVSLEISARLAPRIPSGVLRVSESGIHEPAHVRQLQDAGYQAFLVGEHLMRSGDPRSSLEALRCL